MAVIYYKSNGQWSPVDTGPGYSSYGSGFIFGDSFIAGRNGTTGNFTINPVEATINKILKTSLVNKGKSGGIGYLRPVDSKTAYDDIHATSLTNADICVLCYGTNDGDYSIGDKTTSNTIIYELNRCVTDIFTRKPDCRVIVFAPWAQTSAYDYVGSQNHSKAQLASAMKTYCEANFIPFVSMLNNPVNRFNYSSVLGTDRSHPTDRGYILLGQWMAGEILKIIG